MSQRIWDGLAGEEPALGYSLLDTHTRRVCYVELRSCADRSRGEIVQGLARRLAYETAPLSRTRCDPVRIATLAGSREPPIVTP
jgi:hypothetical protein